MISPLHHLTAEQFAGLLSSPESRVASLLVLRFGCQERARSTRVLWKEPLSTSFIETQSAMMTTNEIMKHWDKLPGERGELLRSGVFKIQLTTWVGIQPWPCFEQELALDYLLWSPLTQIN